MNENLWITGVVVVLILAVVVICLWRITSSAPTANEVLLLGVLLTISSMAASWIASRYYSEVSFNKNLRVFALKAAEKVTNLSNQLDRLILFLQQDAREGEFDTLGEALLAKNLRIESAIHAVSTLKSMNDTSLSDWQGVIGEELTAQREVQEEREEVLLDLVERLESLATNQSATLPSRKEDSGNDDIREQIDSLRNEVHILGAQVTGVPITRRKR